MRYLLVLGFNCDVYRQEPRARIFVGNQLIDEFYINHHPDTLSIAKNKFGQDNHTLQPYRDIEQIDLQIKNFPPLKFYEIELPETLDILEIRIEIKNNDSNYVNGFMTNSTLIRLQECYFFPSNKKLMARLFEIRNKNRLTQNYAWYRAEKSIRFNFIRNGMQWQGKNGQIVDYTSTKLKHNNIGGDGVFTCKLEKKYGIFIKLSQLYSYRFNLDYSFIDYFFNKYEQYANQRNTN